MFDYLLFIFDTSILFWLVNWFICLCYWDKSYICWVLFAYVYLICYVLLLFAFGSICVYVSLYICVVNLYLICLNLFVFGSLLSSYSLFCYYCWICWLFSIYLLFIIELNLVVFVSFWGNFGIIC